jgi:hypothetical protein
VQPLFRRQAGMHGITPATPNSLKMFFSTLAAANYRQDGGTIGYIEIAPHVSRIVPLCPRRAGNGTPVSLT